MLISWKKELEIGNELIDSQHRMLVMLLRKLDMAFKNQMEHKVIMGVLLEIKLFTEFHFLSEENLMAELGYPELREHEKIHSELLSQVNVYIAKINRKQAFPDDVLATLHSWFANHVVNEDLKLAEYVRNSTMRPIAEEFYGLYLK